MNFSMIIEKIYRYSDKVVIGARMIHLIENNRNSVWSEVCTVIGRYKLDQISFYIKELHFNLAVQLLNEAGKIQANFSNSLLLFSERGGFVIPDAPTGIAIATALKVDAIWQGPLITSLSVDVGQGGVKTTVKMDLYTAQFGKLQKNYLLDIGS